MVVAGPSVVCFSLCVISLITLMKDSLSFIVLESKLNTVCKIVGVFFFRPIKLIIQMSTCKNILLSPSLSLVSVSSPTIVLVTMSLRRPLM